MFKYLFGKKLTTKIKQGKGGKWRVFVYDADGKVMMQSPVNGHRTGDEARAVAEEISGSRLDIK